MICLSVFFVACLLNFVHGLCVSIVTVLVQVCLHDFFVFPLAMVEDHFHSQNLYWESPSHLILM